MVGTLTESQMIDVLQNNIIGRIGCHDGEHTYVVPVSYLFDGKNIIAHSQEGLKIHMMRRNPDVCFEVDEMKSFTNWRSVILWGQYEEIKDEKEKTEAMDAFVHRMLRLKVMETVHTPETSQVRFNPRTGKLRTIVYRIVIEKMTGKFEKDLEIMD
jgi:uncharacterized protein